jgi:MGT family glycosyltransferase
VSKIAVVHVPFYSHIQAANRLTAVLIRQGHRVVAFAPASWREEIEAYGAEFEVHEPKMPQVKGHNAFVAGVLSVTEKHTEELVEKLYAHEVDLVVHDSQTLWARVAADYLGLPRIVSHPMFPIIDPRHIPGDRDWTLPRPDPEQARARFEASWLAIARRWGVELESSGLTHSPADIKLSFSTEEILGHQRLDAAWRFIGPLMDPIPRASRQPTRPLIYVCFGTSFNGRVGLFTNVIQALADDPVDVLVSTGRGEVTEADLAPLPSNVTVQDFVPARETLSRASVHISHCGCNSVHESLLAGVPMLCLPQAYDQYALSRRVTQLGAGLSVDEDPLAIRGGVRLLLQSDKARDRTNRLSKHLTDYDGEDRVAKQIDRALSGEAARAE